MYSVYQRYVISEACKAAGLDPIRVLSESTAAALSSIATMDTSNKDYNILVIDIGGGTTDVTLLNYSNQQYNIISINGNNFLGGEDIDNELSEFISKKL